MYQMRSESMNRCPSGDRNAISRRPQGSRGEVMLQVGDSIDVYADGVQEPDLFLSTASMG